MGLIGIETLKVEPALFENARGASAYETARSDENTIGILGVTYNTDNYGVRVLLSGLVQSLVGAVKSPRFLLLDYGPNPVMWREPVNGTEHNLTLVNLRFSWRLYLPNNIARLILVAMVARLIPVRSWRDSLLDSNPWLRQIRMARVHLSIAGGDSFSDIYGLRRFFYVTLPQILVLMLGIPLVLLPQTYGPFKSGISRLVARYIFRRAKFIYSRDAEGIALVENILGACGPNVRISPDVGFSMDPEAASAKVIAELKKLKELGPVVGFNISSLLYMGGYSRNNMFQLKESYPQLVDGIIDMLVKELGANVILLPHVFGDPESEECEVKLLTPLAPQWKDKYPGKVFFFNEVFNHRQIKAVIGACDLFLGSRMHACIGAVSQCVPTIGLAYSSKFAGVMKFAEVGARVADLRSDDQPAILQIIRDTFVKRQLLRERLQVAIPELKASSRGVFTSKEFQTLLNTDLAAERAINA